MKKLLTVSMFAAAISAAAADNVGKRCDALDASLWDQWIWEFTIPDGSTASVTLPGESTEKQYSSGNYKVVK